jgi:hypothetical protein
MTIFHDGKPWSEMDLFCLRACLEDGETIEEAAQFLFRASTVEDVRRKAHELRLVSKKRRRSRR